MNNKENFSVFGKDEVLKLSGRALRTLLVLVRCEPDESGARMIQRDEISRQTGISVAMITLAIKELKLLGLIKVKRKCNFNTYVICK